ncbi:unnamed protein product [Sphagnum jensenii]|uniref:Retroviral polymerase SH3-like domain-containing protein n=1 Tax=Sphagnum jensenii TaxID=128206 RepID=A0ABP0WD42_9BRYO
MLCIQRHVPKELRTKLDLKAQRIVFVGFVEDSKGYRWENLYCKDLQQQRLQSVVVEMSIQEMLAGAVGVGVDDGATGATDHSIKDTGDEGSVVGVGDDHHARGGADHSNDDLGAQDRIAPVAIPEHEYLEEKAQFDL